jgi:hypothetical protein
VTRSSKRTQIVRLNIYLPDPALRRQVKTAAARQDLSISDYCVRAITSQLEHDQESEPARTDRMPLTVAVQRARRFQAKTFRGRTFTISSADLIRRARERR